MASGFLFVGTQHIGGGAPRAALPAQSISIQTWKIITKSGTERDTTRENKRTGLQKWQEESVENETHISASARLLVLKCSCDSSSIITAPGLSALPTE